MSNELNEPQTTQKRPDAEAWMRFLQYFSLSLGAGFLITGIIFFFAHNWQFIHRFGKLGIVLVLLLSTYAAVIKVPMRDWTRNITILVMCMFVGVFLAVYGQIYQTGADTYTLPLTWMLLIAVWVIVTDFYPLWMFLVFLAWMTITLACYSHKTECFYNPVQSNYNNYCILVFVAFSLLFLLLPRIQPNRTTVPGWVIGTLAIAANCYAEINLCYIIFDFSLTALLIAVTTIGGIFTLAQYKKNLLLFSISVIDVIVFLFAIYINISAHDLSFLFFAPFVFALPIFLCVTIIQKKRDEWSTEKIDNHE